MLALTMAAGVVASAPQSAATRERTELVIEAGMHTAQINSVDADRECALIATGAQDRTIRLWNGKTGELERVIHPPVGEGRHNGQVSAVAVHPKGEWIAAAVAVEDGEAVLVFDRKGEDILWQSPVFGTVILSLAVAPDGVTLVASKRGGGGVIIWQRQPDGAFKVIAHDTEFASQDAYGLTIDRRGRIFATSDQGSVKRYAPPYTGRPTVAETRSGKLPNAIAIAGEGTQLAVSFNDTTSIDILSAETLQLVRTLASPDFDHPSNAVAWSRDGSRLYAGGSWPATSTSRVRAWALPGGGKVADAVGPGDAITSLASCPDGAVVATAAPGLGRLGLRGERLPFWKERVTVDMRGKRFGDFKVSADGTRVRFGLQPAKREGGAHQSQQPVLFDALAETLLESPDAPPDLADADTNPAHVPVTDWYGIGNTIKLDGQPMKFSEWDEEAHAAAIAPDRSAFVVGTDYNLRGYHRDGRELWPARPVLTYTWGLNIASAARLIIAAHGDGTIRWYRFADGAELLALFVNASDRRWVAWTPKGYYMASAGGESLIGFRVHRGWKKTERFGRVQSYRGQFYRPDIVRQVLQEKDETKALRTVDASPAARSTRGVATPVESIVAGPNNSERRLRTIVGGGGRLETGRSPAFEGPVVLSDRDSFELTVPARAPVSTAPDLATLAETKQPPVVKIDEPKANSVNPGLDEIIINYSIVSKSSLSHVRFTVNGSTTTQLLPNGPTPEGGLRVWNRLKVPQANATIEIVAEAEGGIRSEPALLTLKWPDTKPEVIQQRPLFALIVGVGKYDEKLKDELPALTGPEKDTVAFEKALRAQVGPNKRFKFVQGGIRRLVDPTKAELEQALIKLREDSAPPDAFVVIYFSGHGVSEDDAAYLLPADYNGGDLLTTAVSATSIIQRFGNKAGPVVLFLDACQSGQVASSVRQRFAAERVMNDAQSKNIITYAAAEGSQPAAATSISSLFTEIVVDGIGGKAKRPGRKYVKAVDLAYYVREEVIDRSGRRQFPVVSFTAKETPGASPLDLVLSRVD